MLEPGYAQWLRMKKLWVDGGYKEGFLQWVAKTCGWEVEVTRRPGGTAEAPQEPKGFQVIPWRWIVERTFGWMGRYRRLSKDYEAKPSSSEAWIWISMTRLLLARLGSKPNL
jgi:putative transposase